MRTDSDYKKSQEEIKNIKPELDVLKQTVKTLLSIKEESKILKDHVKDLKEEMNALIAANKRKSYKISQLEYEYGYDTEDEEEYPKERETKVEDKIYEDFDKMSQIESVNGVMCVICVIKALILKEM